MTNCVVYVVLMVEYVDICGCVVHAYNGAMLVCRKCMVVWNV